MGEGHIACALLLPDSKKEELTSLIRHGRKVLERQEREANDFWTRVAGPDLDLIEQLVEGHLAANKNKILKAYKKAFDGRVKPSEADSVLGQLRFLIAMLKVGSKTRQKAGVIKALEAIKHELWEEIASPGAS